MASLLLAGREGGAFQSAISAVPAEPEGAYDLWIEIDGASLLARNQASDLHLEIYAYALNDQDEVKGHLSLTLGVDLEIYGEELYATGLKVRGHLEPLPPGRYQLRVLVRETHSQSFALRVLSLDVGTDGSQPILLPPFVADAPAAWILARQGELAAAEEGPATVFPLFNPSAIPVLSAGHPAPLTFLTRGLELPTKGLALRFLDPAGTPVGEISLGPPGKEEAAPTGYRRFSILATPPDLATGNYQMMAFLPGPEGRIESSTIPVYLLAKDLPAGRISWTSLSHLAAGRRTVGSASAPKEVQQDPKKDKLQRARRLAQAYREALTSLAIGDTGGALELLSRLESSTFDSGHSNAALRLAEAELAVASKVAAKDPESLAPLLLLHLDAHQAYAAKRAFPLAAHSRRIISELAQRYGKEATGERAPSLAAQVLTGLGTYLHNARLSKAADSMLQQAIDLDPDHLRALLHLALNHERHGRNGQAIPLLRRLLELDPSSAESTLRLAVCLRREGQEGEAESLLRQLIDGDPADWILTIAYQELARLLQDEKRSRGALSTLRQGTHRLSSSARLALQWAYALDAAGQPADASRAIDLAENRRQALGATPRHRYQKPRTLDLDLSRDLLARAALARLPILGAALGETER